MAERSGMVQTLQGLLDPRALGHLDPHEHLLVDLIPMMESPGFGSEEIRMLCVENRARVLAIA